MLEPCVNQAAGLQSLNLQQTARLVALVSHGQQQAELPLLWGLCTSWETLELTVLVLDGHASETSVQPGLVQMLSNPMRRLSAEEAPRSCTVLPAAQGLSVLKNANENVSQLLHIFKNYSIVLIYSNAYSLSELLKGCTLTPLLVVPPALCSTVTAYQALKQLLLHGKLRPTVANIVPEHDFMTVSTTTTSAQLVIDCAATYLGYSIEPVRITASAKSERSQPEIDRLALHMFENALQLDCTGFERLH